MQQLEERAATLEHERDEEAKRAVADERLRIAQELHDVVAHSMGVIAVQAGVGAHVIDKDPGRGEEVARGDRDDEPLDAHRDPPPARRAARRRARRVPTRTRARRSRPARRRPRRRRPAGRRSTVDGTRDDVPPGVDLTAYRIVQEALTNVLKHAGPAQRDGRGRLRARRGPPRDRRRRPRRQRPRDRRRPRPAGHARTGRRVRRHARRRTRRRRRLPRRRRAPLRRRRMTELA